MLALLHSETAVHKDVILFYGHKENSPMRWFSNFSLTRFRYVVPYDLVHPDVQGIMPRPIAAFVETGEHAIHLTKSLVMGDMKTYEKFFKTKDPAKAKKLGREVKNFEPDKWSNMIYDIAYEVVLQKFEQHPESRKLLLDTGDAILAEASPSDKIWGIGLGKTSAKAKDPKTWNGKNILGFALMRARENIRLELDELEDYYPSTIQEEKSLESKKKTSKDKVVKSLDLKIRDTPHNKRPNTIIIPRVVLVDNSSLNFYRVTATMSWWRHQKDKEEPSVENKEFVEKLEQHSLSHLEKLSKKINIPISDMYLIRDCPRDQIWRHRYHSGYKANRDNNKVPSVVGPLIKHLNELIAPKFKRVIRVEGAEADDVIAVLTSFFTGKNHSVTVVANDSDYNQLLRFQGVEILNPKGWEKVLCDEPEKCLEDKVILGDKSDNIKSIKSLQGENYRQGKLSNMQLIDFDYIPRYIQDKIIISLDLEPHDIPHNMRPMQLQLGLCCLNTQLRAKDIFCSRKSIIKTIENKGIGVLLDKCKRNAEDLIKMIEWNYQNGIRVFRISSDIFPHFTNPRVETYDLDFVQDLLDQAGKLARRYKQRLTFHPGQYNVVGTPNKETFQNTVAELDYHAEVLDRLGCDQDSIMVVHGGGTYGCKEDTILRWIQQFSLLTDRTKKRLVIENCERSFNIEDCLRISQQINIPVVFDTHHFSCYQQLHPAEILKEPEEYIPEVLETWNRRGIKPKFHVSEQGTGRVGHHSDYIKKIPEYLLEIPDKYQTSIDIMIEAKQKELAISRLYDEYPQLNPSGKSFDDSSSVLHDDGFFEHRDIKGLFIFPLAVADDLLESIEENIFSADFLDYFAPIKSRSGTSSAKSRMVAQFGSSYDYSKGTIVPEGNNIKSLPKILKRLKENILLPSIHKIGYTPLFDQCICNRYLPGQGISAHTDLPTFGPIVAGFTFGSARLLTFTKGDQKIDVYTQPGSMYIMTGESRYEWKHQMAARKSDKMSGTGEAVPRTEIISITFRTSPPILI